MKKNDVEIKKMDFVEVAISPKRTFYMAVTHYVGGHICFNTPTENKSYQEDFAFTQMKNDYPVFIYKFEVEIPVLQGGNK